VATSVRMKPQMHTCTPAAARSNVLWRWHSSVTHLQVHIRTAKLSSSGATSLTYLMHTVAHSVRCHPQLKQGQPASGLVQAGHHPPCPQLPSLMRLAQTVFPPCPLPVLWAILPAPVHCYPSQDMAGGVTLLPQPATAQSVAGAVAAAQGTDWALAAHAAALRSSWQRFLPRVGPQPSIINQVQGPLPPGDQPGVSFHPMLTSFPQVVKQLMSESRVDFRPSWVAGHQPAAPPIAQLGSSEGLRHGQEDDPPCKRLRQGKASVNGTA